MGAGQSADERTAIRKNKQIEKRNRTDFQKQKGKVKLLLLGTGESGKSTLLKQMKLLYGTKEQLSELELNGQKHAIRACVVTNMKTLVEATDTFASIGDKTLNDRKNELLSMQGNRQDGWVFSSSLVQVMSDLWNDENVQKTWEEYRNLIQVQESLPYFMVHARRIFKDDYIPTEEDWLRVRVRTSGILEEVFKLDGVEFNIWDVGGQRNERRKWIHCFDSVQAIIFVAAINEYDQRLFEDGTVNRVVEALNLFEEVANNQVFESSGLILFLNKSDLYKEKLNRSPIRYIDDSDPRNSRFVDFKGPYCPKGEDATSDLFNRCYAAGINYFEEQFTSRFHRPSSKDIYTHVTNAMDQHRVSVVFDACRGIILKRILLDQGFVRE